MRLGAGRVLAAAVSAAWFIVAAHELSVDEFGSLALLLGIGMMLAVLADIGLGNVLADVVASDPAVARLATRRIVAIRGLLAVPSALLIVGAYLVAGGEGSWTVPALFGLSILATTVYSSFGAVFRALGHAGIDGANEVLSRVVVLAVGWSVLAAGGGLLAVVGVYVLADVGSAIVMGLVFARLTARTGAPIPPGALALRRAGPLGVTSVLGSIYYRIDLWLLALIKTQGSVARYSAAYRLFDGLLLPATAVAALSVPHTAGLEGPPLAHRLHRLALLAVLCSLPGVVVAIVLAEPILRFVFGEPYASAADAFRILVASAPVGACVLALLPPLALRSARIVGVMLASMVLNVAANLALIPSYGPEGAALATLAGQVLLLGLLTVELRRVGRTPASVAAPNPSPDLPATGIPGL